MAAQIVFAEGARAAVGTSQHIEEARLEEHLEFDRFEADNRKLEMAAAGGSVGFLLLVAAVLALVLRKSAADSEPASLALNLSAASGRQTPSKRPQRPTICHCAKKSSLPQRSRRIRSLPPRNCRRSLRRCRSRQSRRSARTWAASAIPRS